MSRATLARAAALVLLATSVAGCSSTHIPAPGSQAASTQQARSSAAPPSPTAASTSQGGAAPTGVDDAPMDTDPTHEAAPSWDAQAQASALARAEGFVRAWARPDLDATAWLSGISGYLSASAAEKFRWTDPSLIPAATITGAPQVSGEPSGTSVSVRVPTDAGDQLVLLVRPDASSSWVVATLTRADASGAGR